MRNFGFDTPSHSRFAAAAFLAIFLILGAVRAEAQGLSGTFNSAADVLVTSGSYIATGTTGFTLNFAPAVGTALTAVNNTGLAFISGTFSNLAQGQALPLTYNGITYPFAANYYGGTGNDLVLEWAANAAFAWGDCSSGELGISSTDNSLSPVAVESSSGSVLYGKTLVALSAGDGFSLALCSDGTLAAWGEGNSGQLGNSGTSGSLVPVAVNTAGALAGETVVAISAGDDFGLALCSDGTVRAWGDNSSGQLGDDGAEASSDVPVVVDSSSDSALFGQTAVAISAGSDHSLALCSNGTVVAWGDNSSGGLGDSGTTDSLVPVAVDSSTDSALNGQTVTAVSAGNDFSLALCSGTVVAWGNNSFGQLGIGGTTNKLVPVLVDTSADSALNGKTVVAISAGNDFTVALCSNGTVAAWGDNSSGQLGNSGTTSSLVPVAVNTSGVLSGKQVVAVQAGADFVLALCSDGTVVAWGDNSSGQLGDGGAEAFSDVPVETELSNIGSGAVVVSLASGPTTETSLAIVAQESPAQIQVQEPAGTNLVTGVSSVNFGSAVVGTSNQLTFTVEDNGVAPLSNLAVTVSGSDPSEFEVGPLSSTTIASGSTETFTVTFLPTAAGLQSGTLNITSDDPVTPSFAVGLTGSGTGFNSTYNSASYVPLTVNGYTATGITMNIALNFAPATGSSLTVVDNTGLAFISGTFNNIAQGQVVALTYNGVTYYFVANYYGGTGNDLVLEWGVTSPVAWGDNAYGELGDSGTTDSLVRVAVDLSASSALFAKKIFSMSAGSYHSLALCSDGSVAAWGDNAYGELGDSGTTRSLIPIAVESSSSSALYGKTVIAVSAGAYHSVALCSDGSVATWGYNHDGELGNSGTANSTAPVAVSNSSGSALFGKTVVAVSAGSFHNLALCSDGSVAAWGYSAYGQLGNSGTASSMTPVLVTSSSSSALFGKSVVAVSAGVGYSLALCSDGSVAAWGDNFLGELGNSGTAGSTIPVLVDSSSNSALFGKTVTAISAGGYQALARCSDGTVAAWGYNNAGQLGNDSLTNSNVPVAVNTSGDLAGRTVNAVAGGFFTSLALCSDGSIATWGWNFFGELGDGDAGALYSDAPVQVDTSNLGFGDSFDAVASGPAAYHNLALVAVPAGDNLPQSPVTFSVTASAGTNGVISPSAAQTATSGTSVSFTATPAAGYVVDQWLVNGDVVQTVGNTYDLTNIESNESVAVSFAPVPTTRFPGTYDGLFADGSGFMTISLSSNGRFTGSMVIGSAPYPLAGVLNAAGAWQGTVSGKAVSLQLAGGKGGAPGSYFINGSVNGTALTAWHAAYGVDNPVAEAGTYHLELIPATSGAGIPQTSGSATLIIGKAGVAQLSGKLPDGKLFDKSTTVVGGTFGDQCFIYSVIDYGNVTTPGARGFLIGTITFPSGVVTGPLVWMKPAQTAGAYPAAIDTSLIVSP